MAKKMNTIEKLIAKLCPEGVEFRKLKKLASVDTGTQLNKTEMTEIGNYLVLNGGINPSGFYPEFNTDENTIAISQGGASAGYVNFVTSKFWAGAHCFVVKPTCNGINNRYLFFLLKNGQDKLQNAKLGAGIPGLNKKELQDFLIPIPPLAIQQEIVKILDTFTTLEAELEAELEARKKQYEYYRDGLLTFGEDACLPDRQVEWKTLGDVGDLVRGSGLPKSDFTEDGVGCIHYGQIYTYYGTFADKTKSFVSKETAKNLKKVNKGDLIITSTSENIEDVCKTVAWLGDDEIVTGGHATIFKHRENSKYLSYYFQTKRFFDQKIKYAKGTKVIDVSAKDLAKIKIPLPPLATQERIVTILDKFDALVNDISAGLPAELNARRKQYEYYRDKLLTFKPLEKEYVRH